MFYCTVRQFAELLGIPIGKVYKAINNNELRPIPGTQPYLINYKEMDKYCRSYSCDLPEVVLDRANYFHSISLEKDTREDVAMPTFSFNGSPVKEYKIASTSRKQHSAKSENKRTKVHVDHMGSTGSR